MRRKKKQTAPKPTKVPRSVPRWLRPVAKVAAAAAVCGAIVAGLHQLRASLLATLIS